jgi:hypothetical protein
MYKTILSTALLFFVFTSLVFAKPSADVCILGSGAVGASAAVFLKDKGYEPVIFELQPRFGGNCDTINFTPPPGEPVNWIDIGVAAVINGTWANQNNLGSWIDTVAFAQRFGGSNIALPFGQGGGFPYFINFNDGQFVLNYPFDPVTYSQTLQQWIGLIFTTYPWANMAYYDGPIDADLAGDFYTFAQQYNLFPITLAINIAGYVSGTAYGNYTNIPAFNMVTGMSPVNILSIINPSPGSAFTFNGGCQKVYDGIYNYIGSENVFLGAEVVKAKRHDHHVTLTINQNNEKFKYRCDHLLVAFTPSLKNVEFLDPDTEETEIFRDVEINYYYTGTANVTGGSLQNQAFNIFNADPASAFFTPFDASAISIGRGVPYGPAAFLGISPVYRTPQEMQTIIQQQLNNIPSSLLTTATNFVFRHAGYAGYFTFNALAKSVSPYAKLTALQGHLSTYWLSSLNLQVPSTAHSWDRAFKFVGQYF